MPDFSGQAPLALWTIRNQDIPFRADALHTVAMRMRDTLRDFYVHLPQKTVSLAIDPLRELELLADDSEAYFSSYEFFRRLIGIFTNLRDRHTTIGLPAPWNRMIAFLPLVLESCFENGRRKLIVTKLIDPSEDWNFTIGVEITHWNAVPVQKFVETYSWEMNGSNPWARIALALRSLTLRPLAFSQPPSEDWVTLTYIDRTGAQRNSTFPWQVAFVPAAAPFATPAAPGSSQTSGQGSVPPLLGLDSGTDLVNFGMKSLFSNPRRSDLRGLGMIGTGSGFKLEDIAAGAAETAPGIRPSILTLPDGRSYGVLRIFSFHTNDIRGFSEYMAAILRQMPKTGLIVDVRANPGGTIPAGEALLRLLTSKPVEFSRNEFRATPATRRLASGPEFFQRWKRSLDIVMETGQSFSQGFELVEDGHWQGLEASYTGPVVLVIDALCYSTTDYFAAGFADNGVGRILGIDPTTGAGGANVWSLNQIAEFSEAAGLAPTPPLPGGVSASFAVRRALRVGLNAGLPLEGLGAKPEAVHLNSRRDVVAGNQDLLLHAIDLLRSG